MIGVGSLWFVETLQMFDIDYAAWRAARRNRAPRPESNLGVPGYLAVGVFILALASYLIRIVLPLGASILVLGFPIPAYLPKYLSFYILGAVAVRRDWLRAIPNSMGRVGFAMALMATVLLLPLALSGHALSLDLGPATKNFVGNGHWQSAIHAQWDSTFSVGMCLGLITLFRHFFDSAQDVVDFGFRRTTI